jgi:hypothetical protein
MEMNSTDRKYCDKCGRDVKKLNRLYGKKLCSNCSMIFYIKVKKQIEGNKSILREFKAWYFEMELEE